MSYDPIIKIIQQQWETQVEEETLKAIKKYNIDVDKDELIKALAYDRDQYAKGFDDGKLSARNEIVHCKDCIYNVANATHDPLDITDYTDITCEYFMTDGMGAYDFCSFGRRADND